MSQESKYRKITVGYAQLVILKWIDSGESSFTKLIRQLQGAGLYSSKQQSTKGVETFIKVKMIERKDDIVKLTPLGRKFLEGLEALFNESESNRPA